MSEKKVDMKNKKSTVKSDTKNKKIDMKKRDRIVFITIIAVIIIAIIACFVVLGSGKENNNTDGNTSNGNVQSENNQNEEEILSSGQIDYNNKKNVVIKGKVKENNSKALAQEKEFNGMKVKNIKLKASGGVTNFVATVENTSSTDFKGQKVVIIFKNEDGSEYDKLDSYLGDIKVGDSLEIDATTTSDLSNAYDCELRLGQ